MRRSRYYFSGGGGGFHQKRTCLYDTLISGFQWMLAGKVNVSSSNHEEVSTIRTLPFFKLIDLFFYSLFIFLPFMLKILFRSYIVALKYIKAGILMSRGRNLGS